MTAALHRSLAGLALTAALIALAAFWLPRLKDAAPVDPTRQAPCDLNRGACAVALDGGRTLVFSIAPYPVPVMKPLKLALSTRGFAAPTTARVEFSGVGMDMGLNRADLRRQPDGSLAGEASLPVCVTGAMDWQAELLIGPPEDPARISFRFRAPQAH